MFIKLLSLNVYLVSDRISIFLRLHQLLLEHLDQVAGIHHLTLLKYLLISDLLICLFEFHDQVAVPFILSTKHLDNVLLL